MKEVIEVIKDNIKKWKDIFHQKAEEGVTPEHKKNILKQIFYVLFEEQLSTGSSSDPEIKSAYEEYKDLRGLLGSSNMFGEGVPNFTEAIPEPKEGD